MFGSKSEQQQVRFPGVRMAMDGNTAVIMCEREASDAAGAYPITPSTQMGEYWAEETAKGHINVSGRPLVFVEPESEHAAAAVTAGMSMTGLRATNFSSAQGIAFMHESLYAAVGKRLPYVLNIGCRAITKASLNVHCGHDDYHCIDDTGFFQIFGKSAQEAADLNLIGRKIAELSLTPAAVAQDGFLTTHLIEPLMVPERELIAEFLGLPDDIIECPTPAQKMIYGEKRRRVPEVWDVDNAMLSGSVQNQDAFMQAVVAQRPYFFDHIAAIAEQVMDEYHALTGRRYGRVATYRIEDADYVIVGQGSMIVQAEAVADYLRETRKLKVGVLNLTMYRPFPGDLVSKALKGKKGVVVLERTDQPLAEDLPLMRDLRAALTKCLENGAVRGGTKPYPKYESYRPEELPRLYSGCYGLGSRDLQPEGLIGAVENMLPEARQRPFFYLSVAFVREPTDPKDEIRMQQLLDAYPDVKDLAITGSENPNLMPKGAITARMHSVGGWGAITTGKNLAMTLYDLLGFDIKANPKYGSEKKGQPTTYYLSAAPEPIRLNCEYTYVDVVLSPDPNVFNHSNPLSGLKKGGVFIIQSSLETPAEVWATFPVQAQKFIVDNDIRVLYVDGFKIAREEATDPELQFRMQGNAFQGAFFAGSPLMERAGLTEEGLFAAIEGQLRDKFGKKGERVVADNLRVVRRGFDEAVEIQEKVVSAIALARRKPAQLPVMLKQLPEGDGRVSDVHRFWEQTGYFYATGRGSDNLADPYQALSIIPASSGVFRDMTQIRFDYPKWVAENCTACGNCYSVCPDSAIPGLVNSIGDAFEAAIRHIETAGTPTQSLRRETRTVEKKLRAAIELQGEAAQVSRLLDQAVLETLAESALEGEQKAALEQEFGLFTQAIGGFEFSITKPYWVNREKKQKGSGGLFAITINPYACKGCMECVEVCDDAALVKEPQTDEAVAKLRRDWDVWLSLPTTKPEFIRIDDLDEKVGALDTLLLDKSNYLSMVSGDGACMGCGEKTVIHLFTSAVTALLQPRVKKHLAEIEDLDRPPRDAHPAQAGAGDGSEQPRRGERGGGEPQGDRPDAGRAVCVPGEGRRAGGPEVAALGDPAAGEAAPPEVAVHRRSDRCRACEPRLHQRDGVHLGVGLDLPLQPLSVPVEQPPVPGLAVRRDGRVRRPHAQDGRGLQGDAHGEAGAGRQVPRGGARRLLHLLRLAPVRRCGVEALPAGGGGRRRRRDVRHRLPEPVAHAHGGPPGEGPGPGHPGLLEHRRPGLHLRLHRPGGRHVAVRQGVEGQDRRAQGDGPHRHGAPHELRAAGIQCQRHAPARGLHRRHQQPPAGAVQHLLRLPARARHPRRRLGQAEQARR